MSYLVSLELALLLHRAIVRYCYTLDLELPSRFRQERLASNDAPTRLALFLLFGCSRSGTDDGGEGEVPGVDRRDKEQSPFGTLDERTATSASCEPNSSSSVGGDGQGSGLRRAREFMAKIRPKEDDGSSGPSWQELQMEPTPTLLPEMRYACELVVIKPTMTVGSVSGAENCTRARYRS